MLSSAVNKSDNKSQPNTDYVNNVMLSYQGPDFNISLAKQFSYLSHFVGVYFEFFLSGILATWGQQSKS